MSTELDPNIRPAPFSLDGDGDLDLPPEAPHRGRRLALIAGAVVLLLILGVGGASLLAARPALNTVLVVRGDIRSTVETNGRLEALTSAQVAFKSSARLVRLLVHEGDTVAAGAVLAEQDTAALDRQLRQAQTDVTIAQLKLQQAKEGPRPDELAAAEADLSSALAALDQIKSGGQAADIRAAQAALAQAVAKRDEVKRGATAAQIASAAATLREGQAGLAKARQGASPHDIAAAEAAVRQAQAGLDRAKQPARPEDIAAAQAAVRQAQAALDKVKTGPTAADLAAAQAGVDQAKASRNQVSATTSNAKEQARLQMEQAANAVRNAQDQYGTIAHNNDEFFRNRGKKVPDDAQHSEDAALRAVQDAQGGLQQAQLAYEAAKQNEIAALGQADAAIQEAQAALDKLKAGPTAADLAAAQSGVDQAQADLAKLQAGPNPEDVAAAQAGVDQAQANLAKLKAGPTAEDLAAAQATVDRAQAALDELRAGPTSEALREAQAAVDQAQANLDKVKQGGTSADRAAAEARVAAAQAALDLKKQGPTATDIALLEQQVQLAQYEVDNATAALADARLTAPFAGTVLTIDGKEGELVGGGTPVMELARLSTLRVRADVDELDVGRVQPGQPVTVTLDAYPGDKMPGTIESLAPGATQKQGSTVYAATVIFTPTAEVTPRIGMAASLLITAQHKRDVLLVPNRALEQIGANHFVTVVEGDTQRKQRVEIGLSNADSTEIVDDGSLTAGQQVLVH